MNDNNKSIRITEDVQPLSTSLDTLPIDKALYRIYEDNKHALDSIRGALSQITSSAKTFAKVYRQGGRVFYVGAGTSGRLALLDAVELPSTFGIAADRIQAIMAGGESALSREEARSEDDDKAGRQAMVEHDVSSADLVIGVSASGETPFVIGAMREAKAHGAKTTGIVNNEGTTLEELVDLPIVIPTGPELIAGSTRLKAGTVQKVVLNMLSTAAMISLGKVYRGFMVGLRANNDKLRSRALHALAALSGRDAPAVELALSSSDYEVDTALIVLTGRLSSAEARNLLRNKKGDIRAVMEELKAGGENVSADT